MIVHFKDMIVQLNWYKRHCIKMSQYFPKPFRHFGETLISRLTCLEILEKH